MGYTILFIAAAGFIATPVPPTAAETSSSSSPVTIADYLDLARANNPAIGSSSARARAAHERIGVARGFPDPTLAYGYYVAPDVMKGRQEIILQQEFPFFGKRGLRGEVAAREAAMTSRMTEAMGLDVALEVQMAFYRLVGLTETARVLEREADLLRRMRDVAQVRYASGAAEQQELLKVDLSLSRLADETALNRREIAATRARLNELIGREATAPLPDPEWTMPDASVIDRVAVLDSALMHRPEIAGAKEQLAMSNASRRLAKRDYIPDFMLGVDYEFAGRDDGWWELMAGINLPIWLGKRRAMVREAEAMQTSAEYRLKEETLKTLREVEEAAQRARVARERLERFQTSILPQAEAVFASSEAGYRTGRVDFLDYLDSERMLLEMRKEYAMVIADFGMQVAALERAVGFDRGAIGK